jgi:hypothetical protein
LGVGIATQLHCHLRKLDLLLVTACRPRNEGRPLGLRRPLQPPPPPQVVDNGELDQGREDEGCASAHPDVDGLGVQRKAKEEFLSSDTNFVLSDMDSVGRYEIWSDSKNRNTSIFKFRRQSMFVLQKSTPCLFFRGGQNDLLVLAYLTMIDLFRSFRKQKQFSHNLIPIHEQ